MAARPVVEALEDRCLLAQFFVNSVADPGDGMCDAANCTLREAIDQANVTPGADMITFMIPGSGLHTIAPITPLPNIIDPVEIDGYTQPGSQPAGQAQGSVAVLTIELSGANVAQDTDGLVILAGNSVVRGLIISGFAGANADGVMLAAAGGNRIEGNFIGLSPNPTISNGNGGSGIDVSSANNTIGGTSAPARNIISANQSGIVLRTNAATGNVIQGNFIGTDAAGTSALGNIVSGISVLGAPMNLIGGMQLGAGNLISGNTGSGLNIDSAANNVVQGNLIGTDASGKLPLGNRDGTLLFNSPNNTVGGTLPSQRNTISGNLFSAVVLQGAGSTGNMIQRNRIGTESGGEFVVPNGQGVTIAFRANDNTVDSNFIAGNLSDGVLIIGPETSANQVLNNQIGERFGNAGFGVSILGGAHDNLVQANTVANNLGGVIVAGADVAGLFVAGGNANRILANSITSNVGLGIDLGEDNAVTPNDAGDADMDSNNLQNFPVLASITAANGMTTIQATLSSAALTSYRVEFFTNFDADPSEFGEGETFVGGTDVMTDASGIVTFPFTFAGVLGAGAFATATATSNATNDTSEFSNALCSTVVTTTNDAGLGSLREAILCANLNPGINTITFAIPGSGTHTIQPTSALPAITSPVLVNGYSQPGAMANTNVVGQGLNTILAIELNGALAGSTADGLRIAAGGAGSAIRGLSIFGFDGNGIDIAAGSNGNVIEGNFIGTNVTGMAAQANSGAGVNVLGAGNTIGGTAAAARNIISGNALGGVFLNGDAATFNVLQGNLIGTNRAGTAGLGNADGVAIFQGSDNTVGGTAAGAGNLISANNFEGVLIVDSIATRNVVQGNRIGTDLTGTVALGNMLDGVFVNNSPGNTIGGTATGAGNLLSGNISDGVEIFNAEATNNLVAGNFVGTNATGSAALPNAAAGVNIDAAPMNTVGGAAAGARNVISGNTTVGIRIASGAGGTLIQGNLVGVDATGNAGLGNGGSGILINSGANNATIGGTAAGAGNVISANGNHGVAVSGAGTTGTLIVGNFVGTDATGTIDLGNGNDGVNSGGGANLTTVGGPNPGEGNVIAGNQNDGVEFQSGSNTLAGNFIGVNAAGTAALGNTIHGVNINDQSLANTIGGTAAGARNVISANGSIGIFIFGTNSARNVIAGNRIGTDAAGTADLGNAGQGVFVRSAMNTIGGTAAGARNVISGNNSSGIIVLGASATSNLIAGNFIGVNAAGTAPLANTGDGVLVNQGAAMNTIGGAVAGAANVIAGNLESGVNIADAGSNGNVVLGNFIGTDLGGSLDLGNSFDGVGIEGNSINNTVGGTTAAERNIIANNGGFGVRILTGASSNVVLGNFIGTNAAGTAPLGNGIDGVLIDSGAANNRIGGTAAGAGNVISGNAANGVRIVMFLGLVPAGNVVQGNLIGTTSDGISPLGNARDGVSLQDTNNNTIGGTAAGSRNTIAFNNGAGVLVTAGAGNTISRNSIASNAGLGIDLGTAGVTPNDLGPPPDGDSGPNNLQNFPDLSLVTGGAGLAVQGSLVSIANTVFTLDFYSSTAADPSGFGEGETYLGSTMVTTDAAGATSFVLPLAVAVPLGRFITAAATDPAGNTSEFSNAQPVVPPAAPVIAGIADDTGTIPNDGITNDSTLIISGTADPNSTIALTQVGVGVIGVVQTSGTGAWSIDFTNSPFADGTFQFTATATDAAGNVSAASAVFNLTVDTANFCTGPDLDPASDSFGATGSNSDDITNDRTPTFNGTTEPGNLVELFSNLAGAVGMTSANAAGAWTITSVMLADGVHQITARVSDVAGNVRMCGPLAVTIDTAIAAPSTPDLDPASDSFGPTGTNADNVTNDTTPTFTGAAEANGTVDVFIDAAPVGAVVANAAGAWTFTVSASGALADGPHAVTARVADVAGNVSGLSPALNVRIDTQVATPSVPDLDPASDTGPSNSDDVTGDATPTFNGTAEALGQVRLVDGNTNLGAAAVNAAGNWTFTVPGAAALSDGGHLISAVATDQAGNVGMASGALMVTILAAPDIIVREFNTDIAQSLSAIQIVYEVASSDVPQPFRFGFFGSADGRFDQGIDTEFAGTRIFVGAPGQLTVGIHTLVLDPVQFGPLLLDAEISFVLAVADFENAIAETDETDNDLDFVGIFHRPASPAPAVIRGRDASDRRLDDPNDVITIRGGAVVTVMTSFTPNANIAAGDLSEIRVLSLGGDDTIRADAAFNMPLVVRAGVGNDTIAGGGGNDVLRGEAGDDTVDYSDQPPNVNTGVNLDLSRGTGRGRGRGRDTLAAIENVIGSMARDTLIGDAVANRIMGRGGNDAIRGGGGDDFIDGGSGDDAIFGDDGGDVIIGGDGDDLLCGGNGNDLLNGGAGNDKLNGGDDDDNLFGGIGDDVLCGDDGADFLAGGDGRDSIHGGAGADVLAGGPGFDLLVIDGLDQFDVGADGGRVRRL